MNFNFFAPTRLITGENCLAQHANLLANLGNKCVIVTSKTAGKKSGALADVKSALDSLSIGYKIHDSVAQNPLLDDTFNAGLAANKYGADFIIGIGGGSPIDAAKAVAVFASNAHLEMLDIYKIDWKNKPLPIVAVGTTAGTGSEVNGFSVLTKPDGRKQSISSPYCYPSLAFGDAKYTSTLPLDFTISTALDALSHALEAYYITIATRISDLFAVEAIKVLIKSLSELEKITRAKDISRTLREELYYASVVAGYALGMCGTAYCHGLGYFLSEEHNIPHGYACATYLPGFIEREKQLVPEKAEKLEKDIGISHQELSNLIEKFTLNYDFKLSSQEIKTLVDSKIDSNNFVRTAPDGFSNEEGYAIMTELFG